MATQRRGKERHLNAGNTEFLDKDTLKEVALSKREVEVMEVDHSILAIFEDSTPPSEEKSRVEEENESSLLTALTEMLDSVGDEEGTMSPFDTLPDPEKHRDNSPLRRLLSLAGVPPAREPGCHPTKSTSSVKEESIADRLRKPRFRSPSVITQQSNGAEENRNKEELTSSSQGLKQPSLKLGHTASTAETFAHKPGSEIEVFTSMSLVNLVKLMHPYCLRLCVEEEDQSLSLQGEIWRYEKPSGDSDEEINVDMSDDDEALPKETLKESRGGERLLKSALVNREASISQAPKEKKRVSFGPVRVTAFDAFVEEEDNLNQPFASDLTSEIMTLACMETPETHAEPLTTRSTTEVNSDQAEVTEAPLALPPHPEVKPKPLSLQQYRELRQQRQPLGEKQGNYTTKWPTLPEPPKELSPILCPPQGHRHNTKGQPMTTHQHGANAEMKIGLSCPSSKPIPDSMETKPNCGRLCGLKRLKTESKIISPQSPASPALSSAAFSVSDCTLRKTILGKKPTSVNSDPPNPVLLPLPVNHPSNERTSSQPASMLFTQSTMKSKPKTVFFSNSLIGELQKKCSKSKQSSEREPSTLEPYLKVLMLDQDPSSDSTKATHFIQETQSTFSRPPQAEERLSSAPTAHHHHDMVHTKPLSKCNKPQQRQCILSPFSESKALPKTSQLCTSDLISQPKCPLSTPCSTQPLSPVHAPVTVMESTGAVLCVLPLEQPPPPQTPCDSGIEASDLTSLLEQFEETQEVPVLLSARRPSNDNQFCPPQTDVVSVPEPVCTVESPLNLTNVSAQDQATAEPGPAHRQLAFRTPSVEILRGQEFSRNPEIIRTVEPLRIVKSQPQTLESLNIPEPLGTDIVLSTAQSKPTPAKTIQIIDPRPLPSKKTHTISSMSPASQIQTPLPVTSPVSVYLDHDYCVTGDRPVTGTPPVRKHQIPIPSKNFINFPNGTQLTILHSSDLRTSSPCKRHSTNCESNTGPGPGTNVDRCVQQTASGQPRTSAEAELPIEAMLTNSDSATPRKESSNDRVKASCPPTPPPSPPGRGRQETRVTTRRYRRSSPYSDSSSSSPSSSSCSSLSSSSSSSRSRSRSPKRKRFRYCHRRSESSSSSSSGSASRSPPRHYSFSRPRSSRSRSKSWSRSRSRSLSPQSCGRRWRDVYSPVYHRRSTEDRRRRRQQQIRLQKLKAIDERRVVYVGRLRRNMTHDELRERFSLFGEVECVSLHFRDRCDNYGFVTFYNMESAFAAIENGSKLRLPDELPFDICFGGRRQFCKSSYADLDSNREADPIPEKSNNEELDFDSLLKQAQRGLKS